MYACIHSSTYPPTYLHVLPHEGSDGIQSLHRAWRVHQVAHVSAQEFLGAVAAGRMQLHLVGHEEGEEERSALQQMMINGWG